MLRLELGIGLGLESGKYNSSLPGHSGTSHVKVRARDRVRVRVRKV